MARKYWLLIGFVSGILLACVLAIHAFTDSRAATPAGAISGVVWQDFCRADCVAGSSLKRGNGLVSTAERKLPGIKVTLAKGKCAEKRPSISMTTNKQGFYRFSGLKSGFYCLAVDSRQSGTAFPKPGYWTRPAASKSNPVARYEIQINAATEFVNKSFGWNYK
jgi:hypothetical protein